MDRDFYENKISTMLKDTDFYLRISKTQENKTMSKIKNLVNGPLSECMTNKEKDYLTNFEARESLFYGLPKVHKSTIIKTAIENQNSEYITCPNPEDLSFRPIVGGPNSSSQRLSHLLDILLKPFCEKVSSFIRDDLDFLNYVQDTVDENTTLVMLDVVSLYTNIPTEIGIKAVKFWIEKYPNLLHDRFPQEFAIQV